MRAVTVDPIADALRFLGDARTGRAVGQEPPMVRRRSLGPRAITGPIRTLVDGRVRKRSIDRDCFGAWARKSGDPLP